MKTTSLALVTGLGLALAFPSAAQTISDPIAEIRAMTRAQVDASMAEIAQGTTAAAPLQSDAITTIAGAIYIKKTRTLVYTVQLSRSTPPEEAAANMKAGLCRGRTVLAFLEKGVTYQYSVTTPAQTYNIVFKRSDCP
jgi:hypothetical protein